METKMPTAKEFRALIKQKGLTPHAVTRLYGKSTQHWATIAAEGTRLTDDWASIIRSLNSLRDGEGAPASKRAQTKQSRSEAAKLSWETRRGKKRSYTVKAVKASAPVEDNIFSTLDSKIKERTHLRAELKKLEDYITKTSQKVLDLLVDDIQTGQCGVCEAQTAPTTTTQRA